MNTLEESASSQAAVKRRMMDFKHDRKSVEDERNLQRPATATTKENIDLALNIMQNNRLSCH